MNIWNPSTLEPGNTAIADDDTMSAQSDRGLVAFAEWETAYTLLEPPRGARMPVSRKIDDIKALKLGWYEPDTPPFDASRLDELQTYVERLLDESGLPRPYIYPTPDGDIELEWPLAHWELSITVSLDDMQLYVHGLHRHSDDYLEFDHSVAAGVFSLASVLAPLGQR